MRVVDNQSIKAVVFDLDGLMFDTEALFYVVARAAVAERGFAFTPEVMASLIGRRGEEVNAVWRGLLGVDADIESFLADVRERFRARLHDVRPSTGLASLLKELERLGIPRAVATSSRRAYALDLLERHRVIHLFSFVLTSEDVTRGKPDPEVYQLAGTRFGLDPAELLVLEDSVPGLAAARASGAFAVGVPHEHSPAECLVDAHLVVPRLDDERLLTILRRGQGEPG